MTQTLLVVGGLFLLVYAPLALLAWRRPLLARLAWRESTRRRSQFALLVVGLMVGSASITASLVGADSTAQTLHLVTSQRLGAVDLTVTGAGGRSFPLAVAQRLASDPALVKYVDGVQAGIELQASVVDVDQRLGRPGVLIVGFDPASQRRFGAYRLSGGGQTYGGELATGEVIVSRDLADALAAHPGDHLRVSTGAGAGTDLRVFGIGGATGPSAYGSQFALFMPLQTARLIAGDDLINVVRIAARGGTPSDTAAAKRAEAPLRSAMAGITTATPLVVNTVRVDAVRGSEGGLAFILGTTLGFSGLTVLAAVALIVNLVLALAEERRSRLAILRALGLTRAGLVALSVLEGAIYSLAAATAGVGVGAIAGLYLAGQLWNAFITDPTDRSYLGFPLQLTVSPIPLALGFAAGSLITLATVAAAAYRTSQIAIAAAVRDLPEPASPARRPWLRVVFLGATAAMGAVLLIPNNYGTRLIGGTALIATAAALGRGRLPDRARATLAGLAVTAWALIIVAAARNSILSDLGVLLVIVLLGVSIPAVGLSIAVVANLRLVDSVVGLAGNRFGLLQATLRPPIAYLSRRPIRTGLATSAFSLVLVLVTLIAVATASQARDSARDSAGFDIRVVTTGPEPIRLTPDLEQQVSTQLSIPMRLYQGPFSSPGFGGQGSSVSVMFFVLPEPLGDAGPVGISNQEKRFATNADMWRAVRSDPGLVVNLSANGVTPGKSVTLNGVSGTKRLRVAGNQVGTVLNGIIASPAGVAQFETQPAGSTLLLRAKPGSDPRALARQIERSLFSQGVEATGIRDLLDQEFASNLAYTTEYDVLLHMGLLVGVLALAMIGIRAAIERRRAIGVLRALGYQPARLLAGLIAEAAFTATMGAVAGIGAGLVVGYFVISGAAPGSVFAVNLPRLGVALAIVYGAVLLVTGPLASRAARMAPTEAIRMTG